MEASEVLRTDAQGGRPRGAGNFTFKHEAEGKKDRIHVSEAGVTVRAGNIALSQESYIEALLEKFDLRDADSTPTPLVNIKNHDLL